MNIRFYAVLMAATGAIIRPAAGEIGFPNQPSDARQDMDCPMTNLSACGIIDYYNSHRIISDPTAPYSPSLAMQSLWPAGVANGGVQVGHAIAPSNSVYVGIKWRTNSTYKGDKPGSSKLFFIRKATDPGLAGVFNVEGNATNGFRLVFGHNTSGLDNSHVIPGDWAGGFALWANKPGAPLIFPNQWHTIEAFIQTSQTRTSRDGIVRWWVDGILQGEYTNINYGPGPLDDWTWSETWDGTKGTNPEDWAHYLDHVRIAVGGAGTQPLPPPPPTTPPPPPPPPPVAGDPGTVTNLTIADVGPNGATLSFNQVDDGTGATAKYDVRFGISGTNWGAMEQVAQGTCSTPLQGTGTSGAISCVVAGLSPSTRYDFQLIAFRGTMNQGAVYGALSNVASGSTSSGQTFPSTDVNKDGATNITDVQMGINQALGLSACLSGDANGDGACTILDIQKIVNAALGLGTP